MNNMSKRLERFLANEGDLVNWSLHRYHEAMLLWYSCKYSNMDWYRRPLHVG